MTAKILAGLIGLLIILFFAVSEARKKDKDYKANDEELPPTPDSSTAQELRDYTVTFKKGEQTSTQKVKARNVVHAKYIAMMELDIDRNSILSVV